MHYIVRFWDRRGSKCQDSYDPQLSWAASYLRKVMAQPNLSGTRLVAITAKITPNLTPEPTSRGRMARDPPKSRLLQPKNNTQRNDKPSVGTFPTDGLRPSQKALHHLRRRWRTSYRRPTREIANRKISAREARSSRDLHTVSVLEKRGDHS